MNLLKKLFLLIGFIVCSYNGYAQLPQINVSLDTNNVLIGDQIRISLEVKNNDKFNVLWTTIPDTMGSLEVVRKSKIDTLKKENQYSLRQNVLVTCFDEGTFAVSSFTFTFIRNDNSQDTFYTEPLYLKFNTVEVDTTQEIKDIKGPLDVPIEWTEYLIYFAILIVVIVIIFFVWRYFKNRRKPVSDIGYDPSIPPSVLALEALKQLENEKLWQSGYVKKYYIRLTDIVRIYIERQFKIMAMEMVTPEIIVSLRKNDFENNLINDMSELFSLADFVKFAKHQPLPDENSKCMNFAINFVNVSSSMRIEGENILRQAQDDRQAKENIETEDDDKRTMDNEQKKTDIQLPTPNSQLSTEKEEEGA